MNKEILPKWYALYMLTLSGWIPLFFTAKSITIKFDRIFISLFITIGFLLIFGSLLSTHGVSSGFLYIGFLLLFLFFKVTDRQDTGFAYITIVGTCALQAIYGILQFFDLVGSNYSFTIVGSFDNPAGFAASLSAGFGFGFGLLGRDKRSNYIVIAAMLLIAISTVLSQSRAGMLAIFSITCFYLYNNFSHGRFRKYKRKAFYGILLVLLLLLSLLIFFKKDSATGRLLIWQTTLDMIVDRPVLGWKNVSFRSQYMLYQADFFKNSPKSSFESLADNVSHPFNEPLLFLFQYGIVGSVLLFILIFTLFRDRGKENFIYQLCILSILIFGCFSYPLRYPFVWLILVFCLARISNNSTKVYGQHAMSVGPIHRTAIAAVLLPCFYFLIKDIQFEYQWNKIARLSLSGETVRVLSQYEKLNSQWNGNPLFLYNYGAELNVIGDYKSSNDALLHCAQYWNDFDVQMLLGANYEFLGEFESAKKHYSLAHWMVPSKFMPLYKLVGIYKKIGQEKTAYELAAKLYNKPVKVPSLTVDQIKQEMNRLLVDANL
ncbi:MAG TPA: O-antigen ligase family protein [Sphingobacterium sp.]|nr:O-antigen ligase family protein [Sphingobacterium sp.]